LFNLPKNSVRRKSSNVVQCLSKVSSKVYVRETQPKPSSSSTPSILYSNAALALLAATEATAEGADQGYSQGSYNVTLGLFVLALPGLWSLVKRSTKSKIVKKTFSVNGPAVEGSDGLDVLARKVSVYFKDNNYKVKDAGETITFEGAIAASRGQAAALTFYVFIGLLCTSLVLSIVFPAIGDYWFSAVLLAPAAGYYYYTNANRNEEVQVKMVTSDDDMETDIIVQGDAEEIERFWKTLGFAEKGMVYVEGIMK